MQIDFHRQFKKQYRKLPIKIKDKFDERLILFTKNPFAPELNNHTLHGKYERCRSVNVTGDIRAIYEIVGEGVRFLYIDTHSNLY